MIIIDGGNAMFLNNDKKDARKPGDYFSEDLTPEESAEALKRSVDSIGAYILEFIKSLRRKMTFEEYLKETSDYIDELIIKTVQSELLTCVGGYSTLSISKDRKNLDIVVDLYFKDPSDKWLQRTIRGETPISLFSPEALHNEMMQIAKNGMKIEITAPEIK